MRLTRAISPLPLRGEGGTKGGWGRRVGSWRGEGKREVRPRSVAVRAPSSPCVLRVSVWEQQVGARGRVPKRRGPAVPGGRGRVPRRANILPVFAVSLGEVGRQQARMAERERPALGSTSQKMARDAHADGV